MVHCEEVALFVLLQNFGDRADFELVSCDHVGEEQLPVHEGRDLNLDWARGLGGHVSDQGLDLLTLFQGFQSQQGQQLLVQAS